MSVETVRAALGFLAADRLAAPELTLVWHAGEPMIIPPAWYRKASEAAQDAASGAFSLVESFQTNGVLLTGAWVDYLRQTHVRVGLSIDGPAAMHDWNRRRRDGKGTHAAAMRGVETLKRAEIPFHVIAVVTRETLKDPKGFCDFFEGLGMTMLGLNFEEVEGANATSSLFDHEENDDLRLFLRYLIGRADRNPNLPVREMHRLAGVLRDPYFDERASNSENTPFEIVSVDVEGNISTFSPELLGQRDQISDGYSFGNVHRDRLGNILVNPHFQDIARQVRTGVVNCSESCAYFRLCLGGAPSNKVAELGDLTGTETQFCRASVKTFSELILTRIEQSLAERKRRLSP